MKVKLCLTCHGSGRDESLPPTERDGSVCPDCEGKGVVEKDKKVEKTNLERN